MTISVRHCCSRLFLVGGEARVGLEGGSELGDVPGAGADEVVAVDTITRCPSLQGGRDNVRRWDEVRGFRFHFLSQCLGMQRCLILRHSIRGRSKD
ncbi:MAG: hypothetical protein RL141_217 [Candidatus Parcubacteria bacterium]